MHEILIGHHRLFYRRTGPGAFTYRIEDERLAHAAAVTVAAGDVTGLRGKSDAIRAHLTRIGREAVGLRGELMLRPVEQRFRTKKTVDRPARAFGEDASNRSELRRRSSRAPGTSSGRPTASTANWSTRKAGCP